jgi:hypothetical protein
VFVVFAVVVAVVVEHGMEVMPVRLPGRLPKLPLVGGGHASHVPS